MEKELNYNPGKEALIEAQLEGRPLTDVTAAPPFSGAEAVERALATSAANQKQHGGDHYKGYEYQHWDFVCDTELPYLLGCATKYVSRWRNKNGVEDLNKAIHYLEKALERGVFPSIGTLSQTERFVAQLTPTEASAIRRIMIGDYEGAIQSISWLMKHA